MVGLVAYLLWGGALVFLTLVVTSRQGRLALATMAGTLSAWMLQTVVYVAPTIAIQFAKTLLTSFRQNQDLWAQVVTLFVGELTGGAAEAAGAAGGGTSSGVSLASLVDVQPLVRAILDAMVPQGELTPEAGEVAMQRLLGLNVALGLQGWWASAVGNIVSLGRFGSAADLPDALERSLGFNRLTRLVWRASVKSAIADPLTELYNRRYTFKKLSIGEAHQAWHRGQLTDEGYLDAAAAAGYSHDRAALLLALAAQPYSTADVVDLVRYTGIPDEFAVGLLREAGWDSGRATSLLELSRKRQEQTVLNEVAATARALYKAGRITAEQLQAFLEQAHFTQTEQGMVLAVEGMARAVEKTLDRTEILAAYKAGIEDPPTTRGRLRQLGYQDPDIDVLLALQHRVLSVSQILALLTAGRLTQEEAMTRLQGEGYPPADAQLLVSLRGRKLSEGQVLDALRNGLINLQQATEDLVALGFDLDQVAIILAFLRKTLSTGDVQAALLRGIITEEAATQKLLDQGYSPADAAIIVQLKRRLLTVGQILDAYGDGFVTRVDTLGDLQAKGFSPDDALELVRVFELKRGPTPAGRAAARRAAPPPPAGP